MLLKKYDPTTGKRGKKSEKFFMRRNSQTCRLAEKLPDKREKPPAHSGRLEVEKRNGQDGSPMGVSVSASR